MSKLDYCFSNEYMVLRPDRAGPVELVHLLFSPKVGRNRAIDCFTSTEVRSFPRRLAIFLNLLLQILLLSLAGPLAALGAAVELVLNLADNVLHGRMEYPDRSSPRYRSMTGLIDRRVDLDRSIKPADSRFDAALCVMASKLAYESEAFIRNVVTSHWQVTRAHSPPVSRSLCVCAHFIEYFGRAETNGGHTLIWCRWSSCVSTTAGTVI
jgi:hypothetical protein